MYCFEKVSRHCTIMVQFHEIFASSDVLPSEGCVLGLRQLLRNIKIVHQIELLHQN